MVIYLKIYRCGSDNPPLFPLIAWKTRKVQTKNAVVRKHQVRLVTSCIWGYLCSTDQGRTMSRIKDVSINIRFICCNRWKYASSQYVVKYWFMNFYHVGSCCFSSEVQIRVIRCVFMICIVSIRFGRYRLIVEYFVL